MSKTIQQTVKFSGASAKELYNLYTNAKLHAQVIGAPCELTKKVGDAFKVGGGQIRGKNLLVSANKQVVQSWRAKGWDRAAPDSILSLRFVDVEGGAEVQLVQAFVPDDSLADTKKVWTEQYWRPWRAHLKGASK